MYKISVIYIEILVFIMIMNFILYFYCYCFDIIDFMILKMTIRPTIII